MRQNGFCLKLSASLVAILALTSFEEATAAYSNYNSILVGHQAAGMGGAYTALTEDSSALAFYNPASLVRLNGSSLSASVSAYQKLETEFSQSEGFLNTPRRINDGYFEPVPSSAGSVVSFGHFALGFSVIIPDHYTFSGEIEASDDITSFLSIEDESLWVGGSFSLNLNKDTSVGFSAYYTARKYIRTVSDQLVDAGEADVTIEEKSFTNNSLVYILGVFHALNDNWAIGSSFRFPSLEVTGRGSYFQSNIATDPSTIDQITRTDLNSETNIPGRLAIGIAYQRKKKLTFSADITYYLATSYEDLDFDEGKDTINHEATWNFAIGGEYYYYSWMSFRLGLFTNFSSHPEITTAANGRVGDHIDMYGFSSNITFHTSDHTRFTFGGYWTGGEGRTVQLVGQQLNVIDRNFNNFTMLIGSSYNF